jgi:hypothetical protein
MVESLERLEPESSYLCRFADERRALHKETRFRRDARLCNTQSKTYSCELSAVDDVLRGCSPALDWAASTGMRIF